MHRRHPTTQENQQLKISARHPIWCGGGERFYVLTLNNLPDRNRLTLSLRACARAVWCPEMGWAFAYERTYINDGSCGMSLIKTRYQKRKLDEARNIFGETVWWNRYTLEEKLKIDPTTARRWVAQWMREGLLVQSESAIRQGVTKFKYRFCP
jgi:hypothetical protein